MVRGGSASDVLFGGEESGGVDDRLDAMESNADQGAATLPRTAREALVDLARSGTTFLPALAQGPSRPGDGAEGDTTVSHRRVRPLPWMGPCAAGRREKRLMGSISCWGGPTADCWSAPRRTAPRVALLLTGVRTGYTPIFRGGALAGLEVKCKVEARLAEVRGRRCPEPGRAGLAGGGDGPPLPHAHGDSPLPQPGAGGRLPQPAAARRPVRPMAQG